MIQVARPQNGGDHDGDQAEFPGLAHDADGGRHVLDRHQTDAEQALRELPAVAGEPAL